jgi:hypothetical protein
MSTLGSLRVLSIHFLAIPPAGGFLADLSTDGPTLPALGPATLTVGDLALTGTVTQADHDDHPTGGALGRVTLEGGPGWGRLLPQGGPYGGGQPVRLSVVLRDLAALAGEPYDAPPDVLLPDGYGWLAGTPGRVVLADLVRRGAIPTWRVAPSGRTRFDPWPSTGAADGAGRVLRRNLHLGKRVVGLDARVAAWLPGATVEGVRVQRLILRETASKLEAEAWST